MSDVDTGSWIFALLCVALLAFGAHWMLGNPKAAAPRSAAVEETGRPAALTDAGLIADWKVNVDAKLREIENRVEKLEGGVK